MIVGKMEQWPTVQGTPEWYVDVSAGSTSSMNSAGSTATLRCNYGYLVGGRKFSGDDIYLDVVGIDLNLISGKPNADDEKFLLEFRSKHKSSKDVSREATLALRKNYGEMIAKHCRNERGEPFEQQDGSVKVHYNPDDPSMSALFTGHSKPRRKRMIMLATFSSILFVGLIAFPLRMILWKPPKKIDQSHSAP